MTRELDGWSEAKRKSLHKDRYTCQVTGLTKSIVQLETHHIIPYHICKSHHLDNLITLSFDVHKEIHKPCVVFDGVYNVLSKENISALKKRFKDYDKVWESPEECMSFLDYIDGLPYQYKRKRFTCTNHIKYIRAIYKRGYYVRFYLKVKANGKILLEYDTMHIPS